MKMIWIVAGGWGSYSDRQEWTVCAVESEVNANNVDKLYGQ